MKRSGVLLYIAAFCLLLGFVIGRPTRDVHAQVGGGPGIVPMFNGWNITTVTSGSRVFATNKSPTQAASSIRISVVLGSSVPLSIYETDGTNTFTMPLNNGVALTAGTCYTFVWGTRCSSAPGGVAGPNAFNFVVQGPTTVPVLRVDECVGAVD